MNPRKPMVRRGSSDDPVQGPQARWAVCILKARQESGNRLTRWRNVFANIHLPFTQCTWFDDRRFTVGPGDQTKLLGQPFVELFVNPAEKCRLADIQLRLRFKSALDQLLDLYVSNAFKLEQPFRGFRSVVLLERSLDVQRVGEMAFDEVRVVAAHLPQHAYDWSPDLLSETSAQRGRTPGDVECEFLELLGS